MSATGSDAARPRPELVVTGQVVVEARPDRLELAEAVGIAGERVVAVGRRREILDAATRGARIVRADDAVIVPGLHDFHLHLVGMARARRSVDLSAARNMDEVLRLVQDAAAMAPAGEWVRGDGWWAEALDPGALHRLEGVLGGRPALLRSHDRHSAWASEAALRLAGIGADPGDPGGGRFERGADGRPNGILRERAADLVGEHAGRLQGPALRHALAEVVDELLELGFTGATDAGDATDANGTGTMAALGDSFSSLVAARQAMDGRFRATLDLPADAIPAAADAGLRSGMPLEGTSTMRVGWAKVYADGALGSRTAAVWEPYRCGTGGTGILRLEPAALDSIVSAARAAGVGLAIHAIGDRAATTVLDALLRHPRHMTGAPPDRIEHLQLLRDDDVARLAGGNITASVQPLHLPSDLETVLACWPDRFEDAYRWASLVSAGVRLAFGSDAPIESPNPWAAIHVAVHRHPGTGREAWQAAERLALPAALAAYTVGPGAGQGRADIGYLHPGAVADLAVLSCGLEELQAAAPDLAAVRSRLTVVGGRVVHER